MRGAVHPIGFVLILAYAVFAYLIVAFTNTATDWWWWFVPIYGTLEIFQESIVLGLFHIGILVPVFLVAARAET